MIDAVIVILLLVNAAGVGVCGWQIAGLRRALAASPRTQVVAEARARVAREFLRTTPGRELLRARLAARGQG